MRTFALFLLVALAGTAAAQAPTPEQATTTPQPSSKETTYPAGDPRACLEFPTRQQVIACAEKYRSRRPAAKS